MPNVISMLAMALVWISLILPVASCARGDSPGGADLVGSVRKVHRPPENASGTGDGGTLLVEGVLADGTRAEVAVTVTARSRLLRKTKTGKDPREIPFREFAEGQKVEVRFDGPVLMSYPLQAQAATVIILP